jgi:Galactose oxidase, central domain/Kelch motif
MIPTVTCSPARNCTIQQAGLGLLRSMNVARWDHTATLLPSGKVLVAGGGAFGDTSAELYDPISGTWSFTGNLNVTRTFPSAVMLANGKVLVAAGGLKLAELYDPATGTRSFTGSTTARHIPSSVAVPLTLLADGTVLLEGGLDSHTQPMNTAELYDPATGSWNETGSLGTARDDHTATLLSNGLVLVAGGEGDDNGTSLISLALSFTTRRVEPGLPPAAFPRNILNTQ